MELRLKILETVFAGQFSFAGDEAKAFSRGYWWDTAQNAPKKGYALEAYEEMWKANAAFGCAAAWKSAYIKATIDSSNMASRMALRKAIREYFNGRANPFIGEGPAPRDKRKGYQQNELLPGDNIWFKNPYYQLAGLLYPNVLASEDVRINYAGEQGSNVIYIGNGKIIQAYPPHSILTFEEKQRVMLGWNSVSDITDFFEGLGVPLLAPKIGDFPILEKSVPLVWRPR